MPSVVVTHFHITLKRRKMQANVIGTKRIHGIGRESKKAYDMTRVIILNPLVEMHSDGFNLEGSGFEAVEVEATPAALEAMRGIKFPAQLLLHTEQRVVSGKLSTIISGVQK